MDANKRTKLTEIGYSVVSRICGLCDHFHHGTFTNQNLFGTCKMHLYRHLKHDDLRELSVHQFGGCPDWEENKDIDPFGSAWNEFREPA